MESTPVDTSRYITLQIATLKIFGVWFYIPYPYKSIQFWINVLKRIVIGIYVFVIPTASQFLYVFKLIQSDYFEIQEVAGTISLVFTELQASLRLLDMRLRRNLLMKLSDELKIEQFQWHENPQKEILEKGIKFSRWLYWAMIGSCHVDIFFHVVVAPALKKFQTLPLNMEFIFFDINDKSYFKFAYIYQISYKPSIVSTYLAVHTLAWVIMVFAINQLDILIYNFENMKELVKATATERQCDENEAFKEIFKRNVLHHCSIMRFIDMIQNTFSFQLLVTQIMSVGILGSTAVQMSSIESPSKNLTEVTWVLAYLSIFMGILFIDCYFGNSVTVRCMHVSTVVFSCPWTELPSSLKKSVLIFIAKTQAPVVISAAHYVPVSLQTFTKVMDWTYKGFAILNQMK